LERIVQNSVTTVISIIHAMIKGIGYAREIGMVLTVRNFATIVTNNLSAVLMEIKYV
jgi:hypothetical protein